jgi:hypothetical protein
VSDDFFRFESQKIPAGDNEEVRAHCSYYDQMSLLDQYHTRKGFAIWEDQVRLGCELTFEEWLKLEEDLP